MIVRQRVVLRWAVNAGTALAAASLVLTASNARRIRTPDVDALPVAEPLSVLIPMRDEAANAPGCLRTVLAAIDRWPGPARVVVVDDESTDDTAEIVALVAANDSRLSLISGTPPPAGWLGKSWACHQAAHHVPGDGVLVFVDADVRVSPFAFTATVAALRAAGLAVLCPYPRQRADGPAERLIQPLLQWSWMSTLPLGIAERSSRPSLSAANGQFLAVDAETYHRAGGHASVADEVLEDIALLRAIKSVGGLGGVGAGAHLAQCRMYHGHREIRDGYRKSLWSAFGSSAGAVGVVTMLVLAYIIPAVAALTGSRIGLLGYAAGVASRAISASVTGGRAWPDALAHPLSIAGFAALTADSLQAHRRDRLRWKGRALAGTTPREREVRRG
ncbi:glycosyltransferase [Gordonia oryzae]|uniref:Glycosyltransferase n=1 Tax=Gordonia oryzae TaxID=2487349 RepID=A0A3N4GTT8_9ACTN|nr:glycosyltransferase family A protein [Gordonia oryzae]RPA64867.1 glycosyltransferase [Gordonia oryzae]